MLIRKGSLVITVDGSRISVFRNIGQAFEPELELLEEQRNSSLPSSELGSDRPGRVFKSKSTRRGAHELTDLHQQEEDRFVGEVANRIADIATETEEPIILVAAPRALGVIRKNMNSEIAARLSAEISKDFGPQDAASLAKMIAKHPA